MWPLQEVVRTGKLHQPVIANLTHATSCALQGRLRAYLTVAKSKRLWCSRGPFLPSFIKSTSMGKAGPFRGTD